MNMLSVYYVPQALKLLPKPVDREKKMLKARPLFDRGGGANEFASRLPNM